jgi:hypothetical protein
MLALAEASGIEDAWGIRQREHVPALIVIPMG